MPSLVAERKESLKAGIIAALSFALVDLAIIFINAYGLAKHWEQFNSLELFLDINLLVKGAIGAISGFLFGVTYRYIVREDNNPHLKDGAVLAFGIVRGLAIIEKPQMMSDQLWSWTILGIESIICFAIARFSLDLALKYKLIKPFLS